MPRVGRAIVPMSVNLRRVRSSPVGLRDLGLFVVPHSEHLSPPPSEDVEEVIDRHALVVEELVVRCCDYLGALEHESRRIAALHDPVVAAFLPSLNLAYLAVDPVGRQRWLIRPNGWEGRYCIPE